jgi:hypothetical protein
LVDSPVTPSKRPGRLALEKRPPQFKVADEVLRLSIPGHTIGEAAGLALNAAGHLFVFSRTGRTRRGQRQRLSLAKTSQRRVPELLQTK